MNREHLTEPASNIVSLIDVRRKLATARLKLVDMREGMLAGGRPPCDMVFFITGGTFEAMVNGAEGVLEAPDFLRVPEGAAHGFRDIGEIPGAIASHRLTGGVPAGLLQEIAVALPPFARTFPRRGTSEFARLVMIARRWGVSLDSDAA